MTDAKHIKFVTSVCLLIALVCFNGCAKHTIPVSSSKSSGMPVESTIPRQATVPELINQARILSDQGAVQDALIIYNYAFGLTQKPGAGHDADFKTTILDDV